MPLLYCYFLCLTCSVVRSSGGRFWLSVVLFFFPFFAQTRIRDEELGTEDEGVFWPWRFSGIRREFLDPIFFLVSFFLPTLIISLFFVFVFFSFFFSLGGRLTNISPFLQCDATCSYLSIYPGNAKAGAWGRTPGTGTGWYICMCIYILTTPVLLPISDGKQHMAKPLSEVFDLEPTYLRGLRGLSLSLRLGS